MTIGSRLSAYIADVRGERQRVAMSFIERLGTGEVFSTRTVETNLSRLLNDNAPEHTRGVRFFFAHEGRAATLFDTLEVEARARPSLYAEARSILEGNLPDVVVDLASFADVEVDRVLGWLERSVLTAVERVIVLVTPTQEGSLPRRLERVVHVENYVGPDSLLSIAATHRLVISPNRVVPTSRWVASAARGGRFDMEPRDGIRRWSEGSLSGSEVAHELQLPGDTATEAEITALREQLEADPIATRRWLDELSGSVPPRHDARDRWLAGRALKVPVAATVEDRLEGHLGVQAREVTSEELEQELGYSESVLRRALLLRCGSEWHVIHTEPRPESLADPAVVWHRVSVPHNPVASVLVELSTWTGDDWLDDARLEGLLARLCTREDQRQAYRYAVAALAWTGELPEPVENGAPVADWRAGLSSLLAEAPSEAELVVEAPTDRTSWERHNPYRNPWDTEPPTVLRLPSRASRIHRRPTAVSPDEAITVPFPRMLNEGLRAGGLERFRVLPRSGGMAPETSVEEVRLLIPEYDERRVFPEPARGARTLHNDPDVREPRFRGYGNGDRRKRWSPGEPLPPPGEDHTRAVVQIWKESRPDYVRKLKMPMNGELFVRPAVGEHVWLEADRWVAQLRHALIRGIERGVPLRTGEALIPVGQVAAQVVVRVHHSRVCDTPWIGLGVTWDEPHRLTASVWSGTSRGEDAVRVHLPRSVHLGGRGVRVDIVFVPAPLLVGDAVVLDPM